LSKPDSNEALLVVVILPAVITDDNESTEVARALVDLQTHVRKTFAGREAETRAKVLERLTSILTWPREAIDGLRLNKSLNLIREALRERLPHCTISRGEPQGLTVETIIATDPRSFYIK